MAGCQAELKSEDLIVEIVDIKTGEVLYDDVKTTYKNGFMGFWLPRDIDASIYIEKDGKSGEFELSTYDDSYTCLTEFRLQ